MNCGFTLARITSFISSYIFFLSAMYFRMNRQPMSISFRAEKHKKNNERNERAKIKPKKVKKAVSGNGEAYGKARSSITVNFDRKQTKADFLQHPKYILGRMTKIYTPSFISAFFFCSHLLCRFHVHFHRSVLQIFYLTKRREKEWLNLSSVRWPYFHRCSWNRSSVKVEKSE